MVLMIRSDLDFILAQIKIAEADARGEQMLGNLIPNSELPWGLRHVDGSNNNLLAGQENFGASEQLFPRATPPSFINEGDGDTMLFGPPGTPSIPGVTLLTNTDYGIRLPNNNPDPRAIQPGDVVDADPRIISNLVVDQTANNPAAVYKALENAGSTNPFGDMQAIGVLVQNVKNGVPNAEADLLAALNSFGIPLELSPTGNILKATLFIGNVAADEGLSAPFNGWMTLFGQFFDHGLDLVAKGGWGTVYIPLQPDDPLYVPGSATNFMAVTRSTLDPTTLEATNLVTPFVDQNQTYTSNASHQVFHREYEMRFDATLGYEIPYATGNLLNHPEPVGGLATWADVKAQALNLLGIELDDHDIHRVPEVMVDPYGNFIRGANGFPMIVTGIGPGGVPITQGPVVNSAGVIVTPADATNALATGHAFLDDIAHTANPGATEVADGDSAVGLANSAGAPVSNNGFYDNELLDAHYITGDGRGNENIGLTTVHHVFHAEHNRQVGLIKETLLSDAQAQLTAGATQAEAVAFLNEWLAVDVTTVPASLTGLVWDGERLFQAAKFPTEMQYQHLVFEEFARKVQPMVNVFNNYDQQLNSAIVAEFAHTVYRFGHSMLNETVDRFDADWDPIGSGGVAGPTQEQIGLIEAFLNPIEFAASGIDADEAAGAIVRGMTRQHGNEIDEFVTEALRNNLVGLPLDLAAINIARGRETGVPTLNQARAEFYAGSSDDQVKPYTSWYDFALNLKNPASIVNFVAAYGTHVDIVAATTAADKRAVALDLVLGNHINSVTGLNDSTEFMLAQAAYTGGSLGGLNSVDFWIGGLAEKKMIFGGMLGSTFNFVFETQLEALQNGDRFYYLSRLANLNLTAQLENNKFSEMIHRNTDATHLPGDAFALPNFFLEVDQTKQFNKDLGSWTDGGGTVHAHAADPINPSANPFLGIQPFVIRNNPQTPGPDSNYLKFTGVEHVVLGGTSGNDTLIGGKGDDTFWGDDGDDRIEGGEGVDFIFGGAGNDIITDEFLDDEIRSGSGDDVVSGGPGLNLIITDTGRDFVWGGVDDEEFLLGQDDDFANGGLGSEFIVGGEGSDWLESGGENGFLGGDNADLIQGLPIKRSVTSLIVGHDVTYNNGGDIDHDAEQGDDIMVGGVGTDRFFGQFGFDWVTLKDDPYGIEADMNVRLFATPVNPASPGALLDRYAQVEALSGSSHGDMLRGDNETVLPGAGGVAFDPLTQALWDQHVSLINGLSTFLGTANEAGAVAYSQGNIILGGAGSDVIEGRGGNDLIDGDRWLNVRIVVNPDVARGQTFTPFSINGMSEIQERMFSGEIKVAQLQVVREILTSSNAADVDVAEFSGPRADYDVQISGGTITVTHLLRDGTGAIVPGGIGADGIDRLTNVQRLWFSDVAEEVIAHPNALATGAATISGVFATGQVLTASLGSIADGNGINPSTVQFFWQVSTAPNSGVFQNVTRTIADETAPVTGTTFTLTAAEAGLDVRVMVIFKDNLGAFERAFSPAVNTNDPPVLAAPLADVTTDEDALFSFTIPAGTFTDADLADVLTLTATLDGGGALPLWLSFNAATGTFSGTPENGDVGTISVTVTATDPFGASASDTFDITVANTNDAPTVATPIADQPATEDAAFLFTVPPGTFADVDVGDTLTLSATLSDGSPLPAWLSFNAATGEFTGTPLNGDVGSITVRVTATDSASATAFEDFAITVANTNDAPTAITVNTTALAEHTVGAVATLGVVDQDIGDSFTYQLLTSDTRFTLSPAGVLSVTSSTALDAERAAFLGDGPIDLEFRVTDSGGAFHTQTLSFTVANADPDNVSGTAAGERIHGGALADNIAGNGGADTLVGGGGNDTLNGGTGVDSMEGEGGNDTYFVDSAADVVVEAIGGGTDTVITDTTFVLAAGVEVERLRTFGSATTQVLDLTGNAFANIIEGNAAANVIDGQGGADVMWGFGGDDTYFVDNTGDTVTELAGGGNDRVYTSVSFTLGLTSEVETITVLNPASTTTINITGSNTGNVIEGNDGLNIINGRGGADAMFGFAGSDVYFVDNVGDTVTEAVGGGFDVIFTTASVTLAAGSEVEQVRTTGSTTTFAFDVTGNGFANIVEGNAGSNVFIGGAGNDTLWSYGGADTIDGGAGADNINGGAGNDTFVYSSITDSTSASRDVLVTFDGAGAAVGDIIDLLAIDADGTSALTNEAFNFIGTAAFSGAAGELRVFQSGLDAIVQGSTLGTGADFEIRLFQTVAANLTVDDFRL